MKAYLFSGIAAAYTLFAWGSPKPPSVERVFEFDTSFGKCMAWRPTSEEVRQMSPKAKEMFIEAFSTTYKEYHRYSGSQEPIHQWLRLKNGLTLESWLEGVYDGEYEEYSAGKKEFLYISDSSGNLLGWLSHAPLSEKGEIYLSQGCLDAEHRNHRIATAAFEKVFHEMYVEELFPDAKEIKLIVRKINTRAIHIYTNAGFIMDVSIDPAVYGDCYDDRYIGFRLTVPK